MEYVPHNQLYPDLQPLSSNASMEVRRTRLHKGWIQDLVTPHMTASSPASENKPTSAGPAAKEQHDSGDWVKKTKSDDRMNSGSSDEQKDHPNEDKFGPRKRRLRVQSSTGRDKQPYRGHQAPDFNTVCLQASLNGDSTM